ncbi:MAG TPA: hypothetical protein PLW31_09395 [Bacteroidales bacterium]|nr:hypothetical protein [Bacteroidales bacterium]HPM92457.1 hypothetical protein [Bacteroidales bacterium]
MKKLILTFIILNSVILSSQSQDKLKIGDVRNDKLVVSNVEGLKKFLYNSIGNSGTLGKDLQYRLAPEGDRCVVFYPVSGNRQNVTSAGVLLIVKNGEAFIQESPEIIDSSGPGGGGSYEIQCVGTNCNQCVPAIKWIGNWLPYVICECKQEGDGTCNMITKLIVNVQFN